MEKANLKVWVTVLVLLTFYVPAFAGTYSGGDGTEGSPYLIADVNDMQEMALEPNDWDKHFVMIADINMAGATYTTAIIAPDTNSSYGYQGTAFTGVFDGNEHTISNFTCQSDDIDYGGLFGWVNGANTVIKNLQLVDPNLNESGYRVGLLAGCVSSATIENCSVEGGCILSGTDMGGLVGVLFDGTISNCCVNADVIGGAYAGGLLGTNFGGTISQCHSSGNFLVGDIAVGGLVGENYGMISDCYSSANACSEEAGGLVGRNGGGFGAGTITNCYATGAVSGDYNIGGLVGFNDIDGMVNNSYSTGSVLGEDEVGGLVGRNSGTITNCYSAAKILEKMEKIYWTDAGLNEINRADLNGPSKENLLFGFDKPSGIALDASAGKMYWADEGTDKILRANLDGTNVEDLVTLGLFIPCGIALDIAAGKMYWTDCHYDWETKTYIGKIKRANLNGTNIENLITSGLSTLHGIALDTEAGKMYWIDGGTDKIQRANLDGTNVEDILTGASYRYGIALDTVAGKMYWTDAYWEVIQRANLDGSNIEVLVDLSSELSSLRGITLDIAAGKMYWVDHGTEKVQRANLDGTVVEDLVTAGLRYPIDIALDTVEGKMYWTDEDAGTVKRGNLDGSNVEDLITLASGPYNPIDVEVDVPAGKMYWTESYYDWNTYTPIDKIQRANLDGANVESLVTSGLDNLKDIALDKAAGKMYWTEGSWGTAKISCANLDGSNIEVLISTGLFTPLGIALDTTVGKIYWTDAGPQIPGSAKIQRANLDGSNVEDIVISGLYQPVAIAIDTVAGKMYWTEREWYYVTPKIQRANLDGSNIEDIITSGLASPHGIALDIAAGKMYWLDSGTDKILRANLDGSNVEDIITSGLDSPRGIALVSVTNGGGLVGFDDGGSYMKCFWDSDINPDVNGIGNGSDPNVIGESTTNMQTQSTFTSGGWDFVSESVNGTDNYWRMCVDGVDYPRLAWESIVADLACFDGVDFSDFAYFASRWLETDCVATNDCGGTDLDLSNDVTLHDLQIFVENWLAGVE